MFSCQNTAYMSLFLFLLLPWHLSIPIVQLCLSIFKDSFTDILLVTTPCISHDDHGEHKDSSLDIGKQGSLIEGNSFLVYS